MALLSNVVIDLLNKTASLTITQAIGGASVETITLSSNQITFSSRPLINVTGVDFLDLMAQIVIFQTAILANFKFYTLATTPFNDVNCKESHDTPNNKWDLVCIFGANPRVCNYSANGANKTVDLLNRANPKTMEFPEWIYLLYAMNHYKDSVKNFFQL